MPARTAGFVVALTAACHGCTHLALERNAARAASTTMDIEYRMVLDNLARFAVHPHTLPSNVRLEEGTVQVGDDIGTGYYSGFNLSQSAGFGIDQLGPTAQRAITMQWGTEAVVDPLEVQDLRNLYRRAFGMPPLPDPGFLAAARVEQDRKARKEQERDSNGKNKDAAVKDAEVQKPPQPGVDYEVPVGWFYVGGKKDVPKDACYVGRYRDCYTWVTADGVDGLASFTLAMLSVTRLEPAERGFRRGGGLTFARSAGR